MITLKLNTYSDLECVTLLKAFHGMNAFMQKLCAVPVTCDVCPHRHMCYDIDHAINYLNKVLDERREQK